MGIAEGQAKVPLSLFDLFKIGIGPSSSHTMGPMVAAKRFMEYVECSRCLGAVARVVIELFGSLALTGRGHGTHWAVELGLAGEAPDTVDPQTVAKWIEDDARTIRILLMGVRPIAFDRRADLIRHGETTLPHHANGLRFSAFGEGGAILARRAYYSIGGGFVVGENGAEGGTSEGGSVDLPYPFASATELLALCRREGLSIDEIARANEHAWNRNPDVDDGLRRIWITMRDCMDRGMVAEGILPGGLRVGRRAAALRRTLGSNAANPDADPLNALGWVNLFALAVSEENAAGGRVVTAPTNGAAGVVPAVLRYYERFCPAADEAGVFRFLLTAGAIGALYKCNASISGAEMGCQGEIGVACSMAAAGLTAALGGTDAQVENAAEIGMEHNLGLTCDPVGGLVQIPCIERNAMGAVKAINAAMMARSGDGRHRVSLDAVVETMRQTGRDMMTKYKETAEGGLAVNVVEC